MNGDSLTGMLRKLASQYPADLTLDQMRDIPRISFHISLFLNSSKPKQYHELEICDLGGGIGLFSVGCARYGVKRSVLVDDFGDSVNSKSGDSILDLHKTSGVMVIKRNLVTDGIADLPGAFDVISTFDSMEHWHHSPKRLFGEVMDKLKPGGVFILSTPNCVNLRKRITVPLGIGKWSTMQDWYEAEVFRGHVREPDVDDLMYIARDMGLVGARILGRNWLGLNSENPVIRFVAKCADYPLRFRPQLCSDIYLIGKKT